MVRGLMEPISLRLSEDDPAAFAAQLGGSFARYSFAVVADHGVGEDVISAAFDNAKAFFALPDDVKRKYAIEGGAGQRGYTPFGVETAKNAHAPDLKEFWHVGRNVPASHPLAQTLPANITVEEIQTFAPATDALFEALDDLGLKLLRAIARYLELPRDFFEDKVRMGNSILRLLHYPPVIGHATGLRSEAHEDINVITLLLGAEEAVLQLLDRDGNWIEVNPPTGCVVVNVGDMLQRLTNHLLPSTTHRVVNPHPSRAAYSRYAMPFFQNFTPDYLIETLPGCMTSARPNRYPTPITAGDYLRQRLAEIKLL